MNEPTTIEFDHHGYKISVSSNDTLGRFCVTLPDLENARCFASLRQAQDAVDRYRRVTAKSRRLSLAALALDRYGEAPASVQITGINIGTARLTTKPRLDSYTADLYVDAPVVHQLLQKRMAARRQLKEIEADLDAYSLKAPTVRGGLDEDTYPGALDVLERNYGEKMIEAGRARARTD